MCVCGLAHGKDGEHDAEAQFRGECVDYGTLSMIRTHSCVRVPVPGDGSTPDATTGTKCIPRSALERFALRLGPRVCVCVCVCVLV